MSQQELQDRINGIVFDSVNNLAKSTVEWVGVSDLDEPITKKDVRLNQVPMQHIYKAEIVGGQLIGYTFMTDLIIDPVHTVVLDDKWVGYGEGETLKEVLLDGRTNVSE